MTAAHQLDDVESPFDRPSGVHRIIPSRDTRSGTIVGSSPELQAVLSVIDRVAASSCTVLVTGESGTGKESIVSALHEASPRAGAPMVTVNCGAIPENLLESELFGHAKGSFTGAHAARQGRVSAAEGGTLFLDEVGELPMSVQVKLLRLLQQREYSPVGESRTVKCNIRVVAATNRDLEADVRAGTFREDLYYRLNVIHVHLPALRERRGDIELLAYHFLRQSSVRAERPEICGFTPEAIEAIVAADWPGNIRSLENAIERAVLLADAPHVTLADLPSKLREPSATVRVEELPEAGIDLRAAVDVFESNLIRQALSRTGGNKNRAAQLLGLNRTTLVEMVKRKRLVALAPHRPRFGALTPGPSPPRGEGSRATPRRRRRERAPSAPLPSPVRGEGLGVRASTRAPTIHRDERVAWAPAHPRWSRIVSTPATTRPRERRRHTAPSTE
jgi:sigma-54 specific flagellar transcriptional regulator A